MKGIDFGCLLNTTRCGPNLFILRNKTTQNKTVIGKPYASNVFLALKQWDSQLAQRDARSVQREWNKSYRHGQMLHFSRPNPLEIIYG